MNAQEINTCSFCRADKPVLRQYLHAKNKPAVGDGFSFVYYCNECGLAETVIQQTKTEIITPTMPDNTPDTELKKWFEENYLDGDKVQVGQMLSSSECLDALSSRDTYWKERVREEAYLWFNTWYHHEVDPADASDSFGKWGTERLQEIGASDITNDNLK